MNEENVTETSSMDYLAQQNQLREERTKREEEAQTRDMVRKAAAAPASPSPVSAESIMAHSINLANKVDNLTNLVSKVVASHNALCADVEKLKAQCGASTVPANE